MRSSTRRLSAVSVVAAISLNGCASYRQIPLDDARSSLTRQVASVRATMLDTTRVTVDQAALVDGCISGVVAHCEGGSCRAVRERRGVLVASLRTLEVRDGASHGSAEQVVGYTLLAVSVVAIVGVLVWGVSQSGFGLSFR